MNRYIHTDIRRRCDNAPGDNYKVVSIAEIEALAGINFFPKLSKAQKEKILELPTPKKRG
jgi:endonuclease G